MLACTAPQQRLGFDHIVHGSDSPICASMDSDPAGRSLVSLVIPRKVVTHLRHPICASMDRNHSRPNTAPMARQGSISRATPQARVEAMTATAGTSSAKRCSRQWQDGGKVPQPRSHYPAHHENYAREEAFTATVGSHFPRHCSQWQGFTGIIAVRA